MKNRAALIAACEAAGLEYIDGKQKVTQFTREITADFSVKLRGWSYPLAVDTQTGTVTFDNYNGDWGNIEEFQSLNQQYSQQVVEQEADIRQLMQEGWMPVQEVLPNGDVQLRLRKD
jgi:hypothetical protein